MLYPIVTLILEVVFGLLTGTCLLRWYMHYHRIALSARSGNPLGPFIFALTDWLVLPLRRVLSGAGRWDWASFVAALLLQLAHSGLLWFLQGSELSIGALVVAALFGLVRMGISGLIGLVLVYTILSWVQAQSVAYELLHRLINPVLAPIRRIVPLVGGVDLSPLVLFVLLQIATMVLAPLHSAVLGIF